MKKLFLLIFPVLILFGNIENTFSWDSTAAKYMPLQVGNVWVYNCSAIGMACNCNMIYRYEIISSIVINSKMYYVFRRDSFTGNCWNGCVSSAIYDSLRVDSINGNVYRYSAIGCSNSPFEILQDSLNAGQGDTVKNNCGISQYKYICNDTSSQIVFGISRKTKVFSETQFETGYGRSYADGIGIITSGYGSIVCSNNSTLIGCIVNGILYGDTSTVVGINQISSEIPEKFELSQNYPNPFNPTTHFEFKIAEYGLAKLTIYDALGKEVEILMNKELQPGSYEVDWDASKYPSGVYYYKLQAGSFAETKKMVLIK
ncbi:MAG: T9SS type A sorting domain-containing protein [Ignavibacteria bacterium]